METNRAYSIFRMNKRELVIGVGTAVIAALLAYEHHIIGPGNLEKVGMVFFEANSIVSVCFFVLWREMRSANSPILKM